MELTSTETSLAARLKRETRELHMQAERAGAMGELLQGRISLAAYCDMLRGLQLLYGALEAGLDAHPHDPHVQGLWRPALRRLPALQRDLQTLAPASASAAGSSGDRVMQAYAAHLQDLAAQAPVRLLAHAYVRYLGDLHGGQVLGRLVRQRFALQGAAGTSFYEFGDPPTVEGLRRDFRARLDALTLGAAQRDAVVAEARDAFGRHKAWFEELQTRNPAAREAG